MSLEELFVKYGTDKGNLGGTGWGYTEAYEKHFASRRLDVRRVLEIGICGDRDIPNNVTGASLFAWREYFPVADIIGLDNDPKWMVRGEERIHTYCLDAYAPEMLHAWLEHRAGKEPFAFICDDAVHDPIPQLRLLQDLLPYLAPEGVYAIEDTCPYKLPNSDIEHMIRLMPPDIHVEVVSTHKDERLLLITKNPR